MPPVGLESTILPSARPQTYAVDRAATGINTVGSKGRKCYRYYSHCTLNLLKPSGNFTYRQV
jgi:hypothetical protein